MKKVAFYTLGCKVNQYDTEAVLEKFKQSGYEIVDFNEYSDVYVVNTCTVTHLSDRKCRQMLRKTKKLNPDSTLVAMGCYAQIAGEEIRETVPEIDIIIGTDKRNEIVNVVEDYLNKSNHEVISLVSNILDVQEFEEMTIAANGDKTRVYIKVQEGCNNYCTYCIIPYTRGKIRSRQVDNVVSEARRLAAEGYKEIVLTGIHILAYGRDLKDTNLIDLLKSVHEVEGIERIRMSSIEPIAITDEFIEALRNMPKMCHHFHLSLQSGCDRVLKKMNRKYTTKEYKDSVEKLRALWNDVAITTDIIVGFPGETDEDFKETIEFVKDIEFAQIHIFPYSKREGTVAARMPDQIAPEVKAKREKELQQVEHELRYKFMDKLIGTETDVLLETCNDNTISGYTSNYIRIQVNGNEDMQNHFVKVKIENRVDDHLNGVII